MTSRFVPLEPSRPDGVLRVVVLGRKSKPNPENENESIEASMESAEAHLGRIYDGPVEFTRLGEQVSGMVVDRATIRQVEDMRDAKEMDLILTEDIGRVFRNPRHIMAFVQDCVDADMRLIAVADNLDTGDEGWETALVIAAARHGFAVPDARRRVIRSALYSFRNGGNVQHLRFGYRKLSKEDAKSGEFGPVGLRMAKLPELTPAIKDICEKVKDIVNYRSYWDIADELDAKGIPPGPSSRSGRWNDKLVSELVKDEILMGVRSLGKTKGRRTLRSGKNKRKRNTKAPEKTTYAELAHLTPEEFEELQVAVRLRAARQKQKRGSQHPRYDVPRSKAIFPGQHMQCGICGAMFYAGDKGQYRCRRSFKRNTDRCWSHVQVDGEMARRQVLDWIVRQLESFACARDRLIDAAWHEIDNLRSRHSRSSNIWSGRVEMLKKTQARLAKAIRLTDDDGALVVELKDVNAELASARRKEYASLEAANGAQTFVSREDVERRLPQALLHAVGTSFLFADFLREILVRFEIVPLQAINCGLVRPRALVTLLVWVPGPNGESTEQRIEGTIDLFEPPDYIRHLSRCVEARKRKATGERRPTYQALAQTLGLHHMAIKRAMAVAKKMKAEGLSEPYRVLHEPPARASRWRLSPKEQNHEASMNATDTDTMSHSEALPQLPTQREAPFPAPAFGEFKATNQAEDFVNQISPQILGDSNC